MREHLYQGKRIGNGEWVEGYYSKAKQSVDKATLHDYISVPHPKQKWEPSTYFMVDPETVSEFTGRCDKNGKRIFEGHIVKAEVWLDTYTGVVKYDEECAMFLVEAFERDKKEHTEKLRLGCEFITEVIGNKWDNPELLAER